MSLVTRKPIFGVSDQVRHKLVCGATEVRWRLEISDIETCSYMAIAGFLMTWLTYIQACMQTFEKGGANLGVLQPIKKILILRPNYRTFPKYSDTPKICCNHSKI